MEIGGHDSKIYGQQTLVPCSNCNRRLPVDKIQLHQVYCTRNFKKCDMCGMMIDRNSYEQHKKQQHSLMKCDYCSQTYMGRELQLHSETCSAKPARCNYCKQSFPTGALKQHQLACGVKIKNCNICNKPIILKQLDSHKARCRIRNQQRRQNSQQQRINSNGQIARQNSENHLNIQPKRKKSGEKEQHKPQKMNVNCIPRQQIKQKISPVPISIQLAIELKKNKQKTELNQKVK